MIFAIVDAMPLSRVELVDHEYPVIRKASRSRVAENVVFQRVGGMMRVYEESEPKLKSLEIAEFKNVLMSYLGSILTSHSASG